VARDHHFHFAKRLLPSEVQADPENVVRELTGASSNLWLARKWAYSCAASGHSAEATLPRVVGRAPASDGELVVIEMPPALEANEAVYLGVLLRDGRARVYFYERCLAEDLTTVSRDEAVLAGTDGTTRMRYGTFRGLALGDFLAALSTTLRAPIARLSSVASATASSSAPPTNPFAAAAAIQPMQPASPFASAGANPSGVPPFAATGAPKPRAPKPASDPLTQLVGAALMTAAVVPIFGYLLSMIGLGGLVFTALRVLVSFGAGVLTLVWVHQVFSRLRGETHFGPALAVVGWLIPVANLILPALTLRDAWVAARGQRGSGVVILWCVVWNVSLFVAAFALVGVPVLMRSPSVDVPTVVTLVNVTGALNVMGNAAAYGLLRHIVLGIGERVS